jgi:murein DD-endopeptidase MepM/ murein hydrolase activator NlpD
VHREQGRERTGSGVPRRSDTVVPGPAGTAPRWARRRQALVVLLALAALVSATSAQASYRVRPGDTLSGIAQRHGTSVSALMRENGIADPNRVRAGTTLKLPSSGAPARAGAPAAGGTAHHVVRPGETLSAIARQYGVSVPQLVEWNGLRDSATVWAGSRISVSGPAAVNVATATGPRTHRVARGEALSTIAGRYGVSVAALAAANGITDPNRIRAGATLTVPGGGGGWRCPVAGPVRFINDYGVGKPGGRFHDGIDIYAPRGTRVIAPVAGRVEQARGQRAGLQFVLRGDDGHAYLGTHLDSFGASGRVRAGDVLGTVGSTGNARGTPPHLHFEIRLNGTQLVNPHPSLRAACG